MGELLHPGQIKAVEEMHNGCILYGQVGSGKSRTALAYYYIKVCENHLKRTPKNKGKNLYIITTARKRDLLEWEGECVPFLIKNPHIDSWNNIEKYIDIKDSFFIFDEQRLVSYGKWSKSFIKICKNNEWILLTATPGDTWMDYMSIFIANGFYKNKSDFVQNHVVYDPIKKFPKIKSYKNESKLRDIQNKITVYLPYKQKASENEAWIYCSYDFESIKQILKTRKSLDGKPIDSSVELLREQRTIVNSSKDRLSWISYLIDLHKKLIVFYNFNYELDLLRDFCESNKIPFSEWNGHKHQPIPESYKWIFLVQYSAGCEGWNCIETNAMVFYSQTYSYKQTTQAKGRINRVNSPFEDLYYYHLMSDSNIDVGIKLAYDKKEDFNELLFLTAC